MRSPVDPKTAALRPLARVWQAYLDDELPWDLRDLNPVRVLDEPLVVDRNGRPLLTLRECREAWELLDVLDRR